MTTGEANPPHIEGRPVVGESLARDLQQAGAGKRRFLNSEKPVRVGELDEEMVHEARAGDVFLLGASSWRNLSAQPHC